MIVTSCFNLHSWTKFDQLRGNSPLFQIYIFTNDVTSQVLEKRVVKSTGATQSEQKEGKHFAQFALMRLWAPGKSKQAQQFLNHYNVQ